MAEKEYIDREKINRYISKLREYVSASVGLSQAEYSFISDILTAFENFPAADVEPVKYGHWINENFYTRCSVCGNMAIYDKYGQEVESDYCARCGAKMDGGEGE